MKLKQLFTHQFLKKSLQNNFNKIKKNSINKKYFKIFDNLKYSLHRTENFNKSFNICIQKKLNTIYFKGVGTLFNDGDHFYINENHKMRCDNYIYFSLHDNQKYIDPGLCSNFILCKYNILENKLHYSDSLKHAYGEYKIFRYSKFIVFEYILKELYGPRDREILDIQMLF